MAGSGWQADYADPADFIDVLFYSKSDVNHGNYSNSEVDDLILEARTEIDNNRRFLLYNQAEQMIVDDSYFPLWFDTDGYALVKPWLKDTNLLLLLFLNQRCRDKLVTFIYTKTLLHLLLFRYVKVYFRRIVWMPVLLLMVSIIVFILGVYGPGDPIEVQLGNNYDEANAERIREKMIK